MSILLLFFSCATLSLSPIFQDLVSIDRSFVKEGMLIKVNPRGVEQERYFFLFNDILVYCLDRLGRLKYKGAIPLNMCLVNDQSDESFQIVRMDEKKKNVTIKASSPAQKTEWLNILDHQISDHLKRENEKREQQLRELEEQELMEGKKAIRTRARNISRSSLSSDGGGEGGDRKRSVSFGSIFGKRSSGTFNLPKLADALNKDFWSDR